MDHSSACVSDLFLDHRETLVHTLFRMVGCRQTAEDLAQEAYVRVMGAAESQHVTYLKAFLYQTARNLALDHLRKAKVRSRTDCPEADPEIVAEIPASAPTPEQHAATQQDVERLFEALAGLSERRRQILILHKLHHWPYERIASHIGLSRSAVEKNVHAALAHLVSVLGDDIF
ncbi:MULTISPECIES: RNA polymerase sigma factor [unclassified Methylocaldum]|jgi:RNA polymerase sigma factor (sigma-70 family)|uniref:RNA polymerase sigma factor n=1 Tax=unclassified Methylocaldum TaxID=2622260 RepID=UPI00098B5D34|nr:MULTISPECIES: sigma-70 family RNA polymerase sigma factor [unclassified Methylocaldum]MBP1152046.1 RNA polymerase sigma-70 factor (ECF subfamily) [Methylocaldum sp. RMAD-M]